MEYNKENFELLLEKHMTNKLTSTIANIKTRCISKNIPFNLTLDDLRPFPLTCPALGIDIDWIKEGCGPSNHSPSIDRLVPELGYVSGNCCIVSQKANRLKSDATLGELARIAEWAKSSTY